ncbi:MAG: SprT family zinc-dependent metalloprotease [Sulfuricurvum sp.]|uniref:M48 family metallopeptidase n=1 Tax=Sulfuricurvum sp. TaxID=2025608 RepID=UPI002619278C|nr:SprT family zinc-dependent metalloprotease [Sulfuricurvum sp.]MDD2829500.1 SprT family zinc-dependent metalloprotease [Sulfuricurvum sp.]MDD4949503.1 SprT family zinc-dependent metalloprotease [Sulfuricurvum sp.]
MFDASNSPITIHYRPRNRNTYITITHNGEVCVRTPFKELSRVRRVLREKESWINTKLHEITKRVSYQHTVGETILFRGEVVELERFEFLKKKVEKDQNSVNIEKYYHQFYKNEALLTLPSRINHYSKKIGLVPSEIRYKKMRRRWGSCSSSGIVTFNTMMMKLSYEHIDYIIVHELAHLKHMNHSKEFHGLVRTILTDEKKLRSELKAMRID